jgi:hypothetical protein
MTEVSFASPVDSRSEAVWHAVLTALWREIERLPPLARRAYLLNFSDGELAWFWLSGVAALRQIGQLLQLTNEQFQRAWVLLEWQEVRREQARALSHYDEKFALLWQQLPLHDLTIAALLGTTQHNVNQLRQAARHRLRRTLTSLLATLSPEARQ